LIRAFSHFLFVASELDSQQVLYLQKDPIELYRPGVNSEEITPPSHRFDCQTNAKERTTPILLFNIAKSPSFQTQQNIHCKIPNTEEATKLLLDPLQQQIMER
jgi:hypothetical protein